MLLCSSLIEFMNTSHLADLVIKREDTSTLEVITTLGLHKMTVTALIKLSKKSEEMDVDWLPPGKN